MESISAQASFTTKMNLLWETNKPMFVGIIALITLVIFAIVFCIVYFLVIKPRQSQPQTVNDQTATETAHLIYQALRSYNH